LLRGGRLLLLLLDLDLDLGRLWGWCLLLLLLLLLDLNALDDLASWRARTKLGLANLN